MDITTPREASPSGVLTPILHTIPNHAPPPSTLRLCLTQAPQNLHLDAIAPPPSRPKLTKHTPLPNQLLALALRQLPRAINHPVRIDKLKVRLAQQRQERDFIQDGGDPETGNVHADVAEFLVWVVGIVGGVAGGRERGEGEGDFGVGMEAEGCKERDVCIWEVDGGGEPGAFRVGEVQVGEGGDLGAEPGVGLAGVF